jgi:hypothetical protein
MYLECIGVATEIHRGRRAHIGNGNIKAGRF